MIIDGYGGVLPLKFFRNFEDAKKELMKNQAIYEWDGKYQIEGTKDTRVYEDEDSLSLTGVCYSDKEIEDCDDGIMLRFAFISISPEEFDFESDTLYALYISEGYTSYIWGAVDRLNTAHHIPSRNEAVAYAPTEKKIRKLSKKFKRYPRSWNRADNDKLSVFGDGSDYLSYRHYAIK